MDVQKEISLRNAISYCIENNDVNTATNRIMEFIRDEKEAINYTHCCETFKDKQKLSFKDWKFSKGLRYVCGHNFKDNDGDIYDSDEIEKMYEHYLNL